MDEGRWPMDPAYPHLEQEKRLWQAGYSRVAGVDEAGRGALAGPVVAAAVILPPRVHAGTPPWNQVQDSKLLTPPVREDLAQAIQRAALAWAVASASPREIDRWGIAPATRMAMARAIQALRPPADYVLLDWVRLEQLAVPQESFVRGDRQVLSIASASILAKVHRDRWMVELHREFPQYGFARHKGYATRAHRAALETHGPSPVHRRGFAPVAAQMSLFDVPGSPPRPE